MFRTVGRIINWCGEFKGILYLGFFFSFLSTIFAAMPIMLAAYTLGLVIDDARGVAAFNENWIWYSLIIIVAMVLLRFFFDYLRARYQESISYELVARDRIAIGGILKRVSLGYFGENETGEILNAVTTGLNALENMGIRMVNTLLGGYIEVMCIIICLACFDLRPALIALGGVVLSLVFLGGISRHSTKNAPVLAIANRDMASAAVEYARGLPVVKSFGMEGASVESMKSACCDSKEINYKIEFGFVSNKCLHLFALKLASVGLCLLSAYLTLAGDMSLPIMLMACMFSFTIFGSVEPISDSAHVLGQIDTAMDKIDSLKDESFIDEAGKDIILTSYDIDFANVDFSYDSRKVIDDVSFHIPQNSTTAIVGPSGSGKTTLCNLMARFYDVQGGSVCVGGHDVREFTCESLLKNFSMVFQNVYLFNDTVMNNIRFGNPNATDEEVYQTAKKACCHDFIMALPDGYNTLVGEGGSSLSGGEKQRISIARAILKDAPIVILDEATASVDPENEHYIQAAISELTYGKTIIIIAHRLATIENADQILVVDEGKIVQKGTHSKLCTEEGIYRWFISIREAAEGWSL